MERTRRALMPLLLLGLVSYGCDSGGGATEPPVTPTTGYAGAEVCAKCHADYVAQWRLTGHARAWDTLAAIEQHENDYCLGCHVVGAGEETGYVDHVTTSDLEGVQCESCHGPAREHANYPDDLDKRPTVDRSAALCGQCHDGSHHPTFTEWSDSAHARALTSLQGKPYAKDHCLSCHSEDYRVAEANGDATLPTLETATLGIECATCHDAHDVGDGHAQLRMPVAQLCGQCHTVGETSLESKPHHPQLEVLTGTGAFETPDTVLEVAGPHTGLVASEEGNACAHCHVVQQDIEDQGTKIHVTGHTFNPFDDEITAYQPDRYAGCRLCHSDEAAAALVSAVQTDFDEAVANLSPYFDPEDPKYLDPEPLDDAQKAQLQAAAFNLAYVKADGSRGVHNAEYVAEIFDRITAIVGALSGR